MKKEFFLETKRLILRNLKEQDIDEIFDYRNNEICYKFQRWEDTSKEAVCKLVKKFKESDFLSTQLEQHYAICSKDDDIMGDIAYFYNISDNCITLGYTISYKHHRNGFAFEILSSLIEKIKEAYPAMEIVALVEKENLPSINLLNKLGFTKECYAEKIQSYIFIISPQN